MKLSLTITSAFLWTALYFCFMLFYTFLDIIIWRNLLPPFSDWLNIITITACIFIFIFVLKKRTGHTITIFKNFKVSSLLLAVGCSILFFILLDNILDPFFEGLLPDSEENYEQAVQALLESPVTSFLHICILAPIIEEVLIRSFLLEGLKNKYGILTALLLSSFLFAILHFNLVQTLSALVCGIILGLLYIKTESIFCCILAHSGYNLISFIFCLLY